MTQTVQLLEHSNAVTPASRGASVNYLRDTAHRLRARIVATLNAWATARADAALYAALSKMSDAELRNCGLSRGDLYTFVFRR
jgi:uncharacterized protein YjiS (DUF1127 family)